MAESSPLEPEGIYARKFAITPGDRIATAGSCFAQHITQRLKTHGYNVLDMEPAPGWMRPASRARYGFDLYSARYGNIYTVAQLLQLAKEAAGLIAPSDIAWRKGDRFIDALRPSVEPDGVDSVDEVILHRVVHRARVRELFRRMDVFVFTLGLTEGWVGRSSGTVFPTAPGVIAGAYDAEQVSPHNYGFSEMMAAFEEFLAVLSGLRGASPPPRILLTVSPVPLTATSGDDHVLVASTYSKSLLRAVAGQLAGSLDFVDYFPSYEIVTNPAARGAFFEGNLRSVRAEGVDTVMRTFFEAHGRAADAAPAAALQAMAATADDGDQTICEDALLEAFGNG